MNNKNNKNVRQVKKEKILGKSRVKKTVAAIIAGAAAVGGG
jgi:hypothetical protein